MHSQKVTQVRMDGGSGSYHHIDSIRRHLHCHSHGKICIMVLQRPVCCKSYVPVHIGWSWHKTSSCNELELELECCELEWPVQVQAQSLSGELVVDFIREEVIRFFNSWRPTDWIESHNGLQLDQVD